MATGIDPGFMFGNGDERQSMDSLALVLGMLARCVLYLFSDRLGYIASCAAGSRSFRRACCALFDCPMVDGSES
jgi:hypothetical protein